MRILTIILVCLTFLSCTDQATIAPDTKPKSIEGDWIISQAYRVDTTFNAEMDVEYYEDFYDSIFDQYQWQSIISFHGNTITTQFRDSYSLNDDDIKDSVAKETFAFTLKDGYMLTDGGDYDSCRVEYDSTKDVVYMNFKADDTSFGTRYASEVNYVLTRVSGKGATITPVPVLEKDSSEPFNNDTSGASVLELGKWSDPFTLDSNRDRDWFKLLHPVNTGGYFAEVYSEASGNTTLLLPSRYSGTIGSYSGFLFSPYGTNISNKISFLYNKPVNCYFGIGDSCVEFPSRVRGAARGRYKVRIISQSDYNNGELWQKQSRIARYGAKVTKPYLHNKNSPLRIRPYVR